MKILRVLVGIASVLALLLLSLETVSAHAQLIKADPAPGAVLTQAPTQVHLWFDEQVAAQFSEIQVLDPSRTRADTQQLELATGDPKSFFAPLKPLSEGTYTVIWKAFSATDGHITRGVFAFSVGQAS